jgi:hypothetical protein
MVFDLLGVAADNYGSNHPAATPQQPMAKTTPRPSITAKAVQSAMARARDGADEEVKDGACRGLILRIRGRKVYWSMRWMYGDTYRRWNLGSHTVLPDEARRRAGHVKSCCQTGQDPDPDVTYWLTGRRPAVQTAKSAKSISWEAARKLFLDHVFAKRAEATYDDYKPILTNTPELGRLEGKSVASVTPANVAAIYADVSKRSEAHAEHVQRVMASMWTFLADGTNGEITGVKPKAIAHIKAPERDRQKIDEIDNYIPGPPDRIMIGRMVAIAKLGVFGKRMSAAMLLLAGTAQRRRPVAGSNRDHFKTFGDEELWEMRPYFRKPSKKKRSSGRHLVPCVGFAARAVRDLDILAGDQPWLLPVARARRAGQQPKRPHIDPTALTSAMKSMPGVSFGPHGLRAAIATYGPQDLGWLAADAKLILDHLEGFDAADVTAQHYNTNPELVKKRSMMTQWIAWLEQQEIAAIAADPTLLDREAVGEQVYRIRYGEKKWKAACGRKVRPWQCPQDSISETSNSGRS